MNKYLKGIRIRRLSTLPPLWEEEVGGPTVGSNSDADPWPLRSTGTADISLYKPIPVERDHGA